jgi:hypothetical protein
MTAEFYAYQCGRDDYESVALKTSLENICAMLRVAHEHSSDDYWQGFIFQHELTNDGKWFDVTIGNCLHKHIPAKNLHQFGGMPIVSIVDVTDEAKRTAQAIIGQQREYGFSVE